MVYNEWGAIIQHQDEMDRAIKKEDQIRAKDLQQKYRADLEEQKQQIITKGLENKMRDAEIENDVQKYQQAKAQLKARTDDARVERIRQEMLQKQ